MVCWVTTAAVALSLLPAVTLIALFVLVAHASKAITSAATAPRHLAVPATATAA